jgi:hypothetical protein
VQATGRISRLQLEKTKMINLVSDNCSIQIDITNLDWVKCSLIDKDDSNIYLGAESTKYIKTHFLSALKNELNSSSGKINGISYSWVLSLAEAHHVLYVSKDGDGMLFLWQDKNAKTICTFRLSKDQCQEWLTQVESIPI